MLNVKFIAFITSNTKNHSSSSVPKAKNIWHELQYSSINRRVQKKMQKFLNIFLFNFLSHNNKVFIHLSITYSFSLLFFSSASSLTHSLIFRFVSSSLLCLSQSKAWVLLSLSLSFILGCGHGECEVWVDFVFCLICCLVCVDHGGWVD